VKPLEIEVAAVHNVKRAGFENQLMQEIDVVNFAVSDDDHRRNIAAEIQQGMQFDCSIALAVLGPGK